MPGPELTQLLTRDRASDNDGRVELQRIEHAHDVFRETRHGVSRLGNRRSAVAATRDTIDTIFLRELRRDAIENVRAVAEPCEQHQRTSRATPVEHFEAHAFVDTDVARLVWR